MPRLLRSAAFVLTFSALFSLSAMVRAQAPDAEAPDAAASEETATEEVQPREEEKKPVEITTDTSAREILENEKKAEEMLRERETSDPDSIQSGRTPLSAIFALSRAFEAEDYEQAGEYLDMRYLPEDMKIKDPEKLIRALAYILSQQIILDYSTLSDDPQGHLDDGLPTYRDRLGVVVLSEGEVPILLQRVPDGEGGRTWKISNRTVKRIPEMWQELGFHDYAAYLFNVLPDFTLFGMFNWQVLGVIMSIIAAWIGAVAITWTCNRIAQLIPNNFPAGINHFFRLPFRFFLFIVIAEYLIDHLGLSLKLRVLLHSSGLDFLAWLVLLMGIITLIRDYNVQRLRAQGQNNYAALLRPLSTMVKVVLVVIVALIWADTAGYNMSTVLAGLGVGSVAVALAAQKTLENLIGAITLYSARPVSPGDFCRFGKITGTVEEIGLRSTSIRTLDRTLVHVPNSVFSSVDIENYSERDRIRYFRNARILAQSADQVRVILADIRSTLYSHPMVYADTVSVRLDDIGEAAVQLRMDAGVKTTDFQEFLAVAEDLNLRFIDIIERAGADLSGPGQLRILRQDGESEKEQSQHVKDMLALWKEQDAQPFPDHSAQEIAGMGNSLEYGKS